MAVGAANAGAVVADSGIGATAAAVASRTGCSYFSLFLPARAWPPFLELLAMSRTKHCDVVSTVHGADAGADAGRLYSTTRKNTDLGSFGWSSRSFEFQLLDRFSHLSRWCGLDWGGIWALDSACACACHCVCARTHAVRAQRHAWQLAHPRRDSSSESGRRARGIRSAMLTDPSPTSRSLRGE